MGTRRTQIIIGLTMLLGFSDLHAQPHTLPQGPITIVVPYPPGGSSDSTARLIAKALSEHLRQPVLVDNKPGAGGNIGAALVARAKPDGSTLLFAVSSHAANMSLYKKPGFDLLKDFTPISQISTIPNVLVIPSGAQANSLSELIKLAGSSATPLSYGSAGNGTSSHLAAATFSKASNLKMQHIPYKGGAPANQDLLAGRLDLVFAPLVEVLPFLESGRLKALGVTSPRRSARIPNVPAIGEVLPGYKSVLWNSLMAPAGTPATVITQFGDTVNQILKNPDIRRQMDMQGTVPVGNSPQEFARMLPQEIADWAQAVMQSEASLD